MPTYHFVAEPFTQTPEQVLPSSRITAEYGKLSYDRFGLFDRALYIVSKERRLIIGNCEGSLMLIDAERDVSQNPINKLHIGELQIRQPHAESYEQKGVKGVRVDLAEFDTHFARALLADLRGRRDPQHREELLAEYRARKQWYCVPFRMRQLSISEIGLKDKISELEGHIDWLRQPPQRETRRFVSTIAHYLESQSYKAVQLMNFERNGVCSQKMTQKEKRSPKIIVNSDIWNLVTEIDRKTREVFDFICPRIDVAKAGDIGKILPRGRISDA